MDRPRATGREIGGAATQRAVRPDQPIFPVPVPNNARFLGWVIVQLWEPGDNDDGITVNWSGDSALLDRAATALTEMSGLIDQTHQDTTGPAKADKAESAKPDRPGP